jgi:hypothetical protein
MLIRIIFFLLVFPLSGMQSNLYQTNMTAHFRIKYEKAIPAKDVKTVGEILESKSNEFRKKLGITVSRRVDVYVFNSVRRFRSESKARAFDDGAFVKGKIFITSPSILERDQKLQNVLSRLAARSLLDELKFCPEWLAEAYGIYAGNELARFGQPARFNISSFADLGEDYLRAEREKDVKELYAKLASTIYFLVNRYGERKVDELLAEFKRSVSLQEAFESTFNEKIEVIEKAWAKALRSPIRE